MVDFVHVLELNVEYILRQRIEGIKQMEWRR